MSSDEEVEDLLSAFDDRPAGLLKKEAADESPQPATEPIAAPGQPETEAGPGVGETAPSQPVAAQTASQPSQSKPETGPVVGEAESPQAATEPIAALGQPKTEARPGVGETAPSQPVAAQTASQPKPEAEPVVGEAESPQAATEPNAAPGQPKTEARPGVGETAPSQPVAAQTASQPSQPKPETGPVVGESAPGQSVAAPPPQAPYLDPSAFFTQLQAETKRPRRTLRLILRWTAALLVAGAVGAATAYGVTLPRRTDVPFLTTPNDGRYEFPGLVKPASSPAPDNADANPAQIHYGDLRQYLLAAPRGARVTEDGWLPTKDFEAEFVDADLPGLLNDNGLRRIAQRGWTTPDGQHTVIRLVQFPDHQTAYAVGPPLSRAEFRAFRKAEDTPPTLTVPAFGDDKLTVPIVRYDEVDKLPNTIARSAVFQIGDVEVVVTTTAPKRVPDVATEQVVLLQAEMLR